MLTHPPIPVELIGLGPISIRWYSLMYIFGFIFLFWFVRREIENNRIFIAKSKLHKDSTELFSDLIFYFMLGLMIGGRIGYAVLYNPHYYFVEDPLAILRPWEGGMSFHGALIGTYVSAYIGIRRLKPKLKDFNLLDLSDVVLTAVPLGLGAGRFGNFINGELYGRPTNAPWGMVFPRRPELGHSGGRLIPIDSVQDMIDSGKMTEFIINGQTFVQVPRHPSQLYQMILEGLLILCVQMLLYYRYPLSKYRGFLTGTFLTMYGCGRIFAEFFREPDSQMGFLYGEWITAGMMYSLPMVFAGMFVVYYSLRQRIPNPIRVK